MDKKKYKIDKPTIRSPWFKIVARYLQCRRQELLGLPPLEFVVFEKPGIGVFNQSGINKVELHD